MRTLNLRRLLPIFAILIVMVPLLAGCTDADSDKVDEQRKESVQDRGDMMARAESKFPAPTTLTNFPIRGALRDFTLRQDLINHPWYIYLQNMLGEYTGYYVGKTYPISTCAFLSSTENIIYDDQGNLITTAPSYDGIFYGGGGSSAACNGMFFFDVVTDAMITFSTPFWTASDIPIDCACPRKNSGAVYAEPDASPVAGQ